MQIFRKCVKIVAVKLKSEIIADKSTSYLSSETFTVFFVAYEVGFEKATLFIECGKCYNYYDKSIITYIVLVINFYLHVVSFQQLSFVVLFQSSLCTVS